jgi:hypothetical protein
MGIRCWFALHDLPNLSILQGRDESVVQLHEKLLVILSEKAIKSSWIGQEVEAALFQENQLRQDILLPIRLDNTITDSQSSWTTQLRQHHIIDFTRWQDPIAYAEAFAALLVHLKV